MLALFHFGGNPNVGRIYSNTRRIRSLVAHLGLYFSFCLILMIEEIIDGKNNANSTYSIFKWRFGSHIGYSHIAGMFFILWSYQNIYSSNPPVYVLASGWLAVKVFKCIKVQRRMAAIRWRILVTIVGGDLICTTASITRGIFILQQKSVAAMLVGIIEVRPCLALFVMTFWISACPSVDLLSQPRTFSSLWVGFWSSSQSGRKDVLCARWSPTCHLLWEGQMKEKPEVSRFNF